MSNQSSLPLDPPASAPASGTKTLDPPPTVTRVFGVSCGMPAETFFRLLKYGNVDTLVDTRLSRSYQNARFADGGDLPYLCRVHNVAYKAVDELAPTRELRDALAKAFSDVKRAEDRDPEAWTRFLEGYARLLTDRKFLRVDGPTYGLLYAQGPRSVAFLCACGQPDDCHRSALVALISRFVQGVQTGQLMPSVLRQKGVEDPAFKSPRRYRVLHIPLANLRANATPSAFRDVERWRKRFPSGGVP